MATFIFFLRPFFQIPMPVKFCTEATHDKLLLTAYAYSYLLTIRVFYFTSLCFWLKY